MWRSITSCCSNSCVRYSRAILHRCAAQECRISNLCPKSREHENTWEQFYSSWENLAKCQLQHGGKGKQFETCSGELSAQCDATMSRSRTTSRKLRGSDTLQQVAADFVVDAPNAEQWKTLRKKHTQLWGSCLRRYGASNSYFGKKLHPTVQWLPRYVTCVNGKEPFWWT